MAEVKAPLTWPKSVDSSSSLAWPGVDGDEGFIAARGVGVDGLGDQFLAGSALALNEHRGAAGSHLCDQVEDAQHDFALAHDVGEVVALLEGALELQVLFFGLVSSDGGADVGQQLLVVPGLLDEVFRAGPDGIHHIVNGAVGSDHDDRQLGLALLDQGQQFQAALAGKARSSSTRSKFSRSRTRSPSSPSTAILTVYPPG